MKNYIIVLRETERFGSVKLSKGFKDLNKAREFANDLVRQHTTDEEQIKFITEKIGDPIEFVDNDNNFLEIEIFETEVEV